MKKLILVIISLSLLLVSCGKDGSNENPPSDALILSNQTIVFSDVGESIDITAKIIENGQVLSAESASEIVWLSQNTDVAICNGGTVTAVGYGSCAIKATYKQMTALCFVINPSPFPTLSISEHEITFDNIGHKTMITATSDTGEDITSLSTWISSNEKIATCKNGVVTAVGYGSCTITVIYQNSKTAVCNISVKNPTSSNITLSEKELKLDVGDTHTLTVESFSDNNGNITWTSSNPNIATCENGVVVAKKRGICAIIATSENNHSAVAIVNVGNATFSHKHPEYLTFSFHNLNKELQTIDKSTGEIISTAVITSCKMDTQLLEDGRLVVEITLLGTKTYDKDGVLGKSPLIVTSSLYRENNTFLDKKQYNVLDVGVGEEFSVKCSGFTVQTRTDGTARDLYMLFSSISQQ